MKHSACSLCALMAYRVSWALLIVGGLLAQVTNPAVAQIAVAMFLLGFVIQVVRLLYLVGRWTTPKHFF